MTQSAMRITIRYQDQNQTAFQNIAAGAHRSFIAAHATHRTNGVE